MSDTHTSSGVGQDPHESSQISGAINIDNPLHKKMDRTSSERDSIDNDIPEAEIGLRHHHRNSFMVSVQTGQAHGHFKHMDSLDLARDIREAETVEGLPPESVSEPRADSDEAAPSERTNRRGSLLRQHSEFEFHSSVRRPRSGRKLTFDDDHGKSLEKTSFSASLHYCYDLNEHEHMAPKSPRGCCSLM